MVVMSQLRTPYYSDCRTQGQDDKLTDCQYLLTDQGRRNEFPSAYRQDESLPLHQMAGSSTYGKKRVGTLDVTNPMEQETLLNPGPVKFSTCWESQTVPSDDLNFKNTSGKTDVEASPPKDRFNLVFFILILHGIGILIPWNMFITAKPYFEGYKLNVNSSDGAVVEHYREHFMSYVGIAAQVPNVVCNALNLFIQFGGGQLTFRIVGSIFIEVIVVIFTVILAMIDSSTWPLVFFYITMVSVVIMNMATGVYQNSVYGLAAKLPMKYSMAIILGSNTSGVLTALLSILSIAASPSVRTAAVYYFITALFILLVCLDTYFALPLIRFYRYHEKLAEKAASGEIGKRSPPYWEVFKKAWPQCFNVFFVFFVTLTVFPAIHSNIERIDPNFFVPEKYFVEVTCYLTFNAFAMFGSLLPNWITWPGPRFLWIPVILRFLMIPFFMLCNYRPDKRSIPVIMNNDWAYFIMATFFGATSGYFSSLAMMYAPRCVKPEHASTAGMMAALFLVLGIVCGVNFTFVASWMVETRLF